MRKFQLVMAYITLLLMFSTAVCGFWIHSAGSKVADPQSSIRFHMTIGLLTVVSFFITFISIIFSKNKPQKKRMQNSTEEA